MSACDSVATGDEVMVEVSTIYDATVTVDNEDHFIVDEDVLLAVME